MLVIPELSWHSVQLESQNTSDYLQDPVPGGAETTASTLPREAVDSHSMKWEGGGVELHFTENNTEVSRNAF